MKTDPMTTPPAPTIDTRPVPVAEWITAKGDRVPIKPKQGVAFQLDELQNLVGGYIEIVQIHGGKLMICDEEGVLKKKPRNDCASEMALHLATMGGIRGDVVICDSISII